MSPPFRNAGTCAQVWRWQRGFGGVEVVEDLAADLHQGTILQTFEERTTEEDVAHEFVANALQKNDPSSTL